MKRWFLLVQLLLTVLYQKCSLQLYPLISLSVGIGIAFILTGCITGPPEIGLPPCDAIAPYNENPQRYLSGRIVGDITSIENSWSNDSSEIKVINERDDLQTIKPHVSQQAYDLLMTTDFSSHFVVMVFDGVHDNSWLQSASAGYVFCVSNWRYESSEMEIFVQLIEVPTLPSMDMTYYYYFQIPRDATWRGKVIFKLSQTRHLALYTKVGKTYNIALQDGIIQQTSFEFP